MAVFAWIVNFWLHPDYATSSDASLYASIARNIVKGNGPYAPAVFPIIFSYPIPTFSSGWPSVYNYFHPLIIFFFFLLFGINHFSLVLTNALFYLATLPFLYFLARKLYNLRVAFLACIWYLFSPSILGASISGMTEPLFTFLIVLAVFLIFTTKNHFFWVGIITGLAYQTRFQGILFLPVFFFYIILATKKKLLSALQFLGGFIIITLLFKIFLPPMAQDYAHFNNLYLWTVMAVDALSPFLEIFRTFSLITFPEIMANFHLIIFKVLKNSYFFYQNLFTFTVAPITLFYILNFFTPSHTRKVSHFKLLSLSLILLFLVFHLFVLFDFRFFTPLLPLIIIVAAANFWTILEKFNPKKATLLATIFTFLFLVIPAFTYPGAATAVQRSLAKPRQPTIYYLLAKLAKENIPENSIVVSDKPEHLAWFGDRRSVLVPLKPESLPELEKKVSIDALFLSNYYPEHFPQWQDLVENPRDFGNFSLAKKFEIKPEENYYRIPVKAVLYLKKTP